MFFFFSLKSNFCWGSTWLSPMQFFLVLICLRLNSLFVFYYENVLNFQYQIEQMEPSTWHARPFFSSTILPLRRSRMYGSEYIRMHTPCKNFVLNVTFGKMFQEWLESVFMLDNFVCWSKWNFEAPRVCACVSFFGKHKFKAQKRTFFLLNSVNTVNCQTE